MKFKIYIIFLILFVFSVIAFAENNAAYSLGIFQQDDSGITCRVKFDTVLVFAHQKNGYWLTAVDMDGAPKSIKKGDFTLPQISYSFGVPVSSNPTVTLLNEQHETRSVNFPVEQNDSINLLPETFAEWNPQKSVDSGGTGLMRRQQIFNVIINPVLYNARARLLKISKSVTFRIDFNASVNSSQNFSSNDSFDHYLEKLLVNSEQAAKWKSRKTPALQKISATSPNSARLYIKDDGVYAVTGQQLIDAGIPVQSIPLSTFALKNKGRDVPIFFEGMADGVFDKKDRFVFVGQHNSGENSSYSLFSELNVYVLEWGGGVGARFYPIDGKPDVTVVNSVNSARVSKHFEKDLTYQLLPSYSDSKADRWMWKQLDEDFSLDLDMPDIDTTHPVQITAGLFGLTKLQPNPDHHWNLFFMGNNIGEAVWDNQTPYVFDSGEFYPATNSNPTFELKPVAIPGVSNDIVFLNWIQVDYSQKLIANKDSLAFTVETNQFTKIRIDGFSKDNVYLLSPSGIRITNPTVINNGANYSVEFVNATNDSINIVAVTNSNIKNVIKIEKDTESDLTASSNQAEYIIVTHQNFIEQANKLAEFRTSQNLSSMVVDIQDVFDEFSDGVYDPRAVKRFLQYAFQNWQEPAPLYILLFGDTTFKLEKEVTSEETQTSFVPTMMEFTDNWGMVSSDNYFVTISGDDVLPDMFIGRLPANSTEEADIMVQKIIDYETVGIVDEWRRNIGMLTGTDEVFEKSAQKIYDEHIPKYMYTGWVGAREGFERLGTTEDVAEMINNGQAIVNFIGHGGGEVFSDGELFLNEDILRLNNKNRYFFMVSITCFIGHFDNHESRSLAENMLITPDKGTIANFGSSGKTYISGGDMLNFAMYDLIFKDGYRSLGEITSLSKIKMLNQTSVFNDNVKNYNLLGDPATQLQLPENNITLNLPQTALGEYDHLEVGGKISNGVQGDVKLAVYNHKDSLLVSNTTSVLNDSFYVDLLKIEPDVRAVWPQNGGAGYVRAYVSDNVRDAVGSAAFKIEQPLIQHVYTIPENPTHLEPTTFYVEIDTNSNILANRKVADIKIYWSNDADNLDKTMSTRQISDNRWATQASIASSERSTVYYKILVFLEDGYSFNSSQYSYYVPKRADLVLDTSSLKLSGDQLLFTVKNVGDTPATDFRVVILPQFDYILDGVRTDSLDVPFLEAKSDTTLWYQIADFKPGTLDLNIKIDPGFVVNETDEGNNEFTQKIFLATANAGTNNAVVAIYDNLGVQFDKNDLSVNTAFSVSENDSLSQYKTSQGLVPLPLKGNVDWQAFSVSYLNSGDGFTDSLKVIMEFDAGKSQLQNYRDAKQMRIFAWDGLAKTWIGMPTLVQINKVTAKVPTRFNSFAFFANTDAAPPEIDVTVEGQNFADGDYVVPNPIFVIKVNDENGFDPLHSPVTIQLNDVKVNSDEIIVFQDKNDPENLIITYSPDVNRGQQTMTVSATDINGNSAVSAYEFTIFGDLSIRTLANHPNPFSDMTIIAFTLTGFAEQVDVDIFTVSGRLIKSFDFYDISGYVEQDWDGTDEHGNDVANGVYYLRLKIHTNDKTIEKTTKVARVQ